MKAMILAAGRGERLGALTLTTPKPLVDVCGDFPLACALRGFARAGFAGVVINVSHLGGKIRAAVGDGERFGIPVSYSEEDAPLETAGGIRLALARGLLDADAPFALANGDVLTDYDFARLRVLESGLCRMVLVANPPEHPRGDFSADAEGGLTRKAEGNALTYSGLGVFAPEMFAGLAAGEGGRLGPLLFSALERGRAGFEIHTGAWFDIGHPESLARARQEWTGRDFPESVGG